MNWARRGAIVVMRVINEPETTQARCATALGHSLPRLCFIYMVISAGESVSPSTVLCCVVLLPLPTDNADFSLITFCTPSRTWDCSVIVDKASSLSHGFCFCSWTYSRKVTLISRTKARSLTKLVRRTLTLNVISLNFADVTVLHPYIHLYRVSRNSGLINQTIIFIKSKSPFLCVHSPFCFV